MTCQHHSYRSLCIVKEQATCHNSYPAARSRKALICGAFADWYHAGRRRQPPFWLRETIWKAWLAILNA